MADKVLFDLVSPERLVWSGEVDSVNIPGVEGDFGVLPNHSPVMSMIRPGVIRVENDANISAYEIDGGFVDVTPSGVTVLAEIIRAADEADV